MERKLLELKAASLSESGELTGYASVTGNMDRASEIIAPGAYKNLATFVEQGFSAVGHDWYGLPIGTIEEAREDDRGLYVRMAFHSTDDAQQARTVVRERLARGKMVGLSIGYRVLADEYRTVDGESIRTLTEIELYEFSVVTVPANPLATVTGAKADAGCPLDEHLDAVRVAVRDVTTRATKVAALRREGGRKLSPERVAQLAEVRAGLDSLIETVTRPDEDEAKAQKIAELAFRTLATRTR